MVSLIHGLDFTLRPYVYACSSRYFNKKKKNVLKFELKPYQSDSVGYISNVYMSMEKTGKKTPSTLVQDISKC